MKHLPLFVFALWLTRQIRSCNTYEQLVTCENLFEQNVMDRSSELDFQASKKAIMGELQIKRTQLVLENQLTN